MQRSQLVLIKSLHTVIVGMMSVCILYILYCGLTRTYDWKLAIALVVVGMESVVFLVNGRRCPLTKMAADYGAATGENWTDDVYLPHWLTPYITPVCSTLFIVGLVTLIFNFLLWQLG